jgi:hypothetical protein
MFGFGRKKSFLGPGVETQMIAEREVSILSPSNLMCEAVYLRSCDFRYQMMGLCFGGRGGGLRLTKLRQRTFGPFLARLDG